MINTHNAIAVMWQFLCVKCNKESVVKQRLDYRDEIGIAEFPYNWRSIDGKLYCPSHKFKIEVK